jgi:hypothetical protein
MVEPMLVGVFELPWTEAGGDDCQRVCFDVRQDIVRVTSANRMLA